MEILSADYFLTLFLTICVAVAGIFAPQSFEKGTSRLSAEQMSWMHCRIFGSCIFFGGIFLLAGLLDWIGTFGMVLAGEVLFFGFMYFTGLLAHESDKARVMRETARKEQEKARAEQRAREEKERVQAEQERARAEQERLTELERRFDFHCTLVFSAYAYHVLECLRSENLFLDEADLTYDEEFMRDVEGDSLTLTETFVWRSEFACALQYPERQSSQATLEIARRLIVDFVRRYDAEARVAASCIAS